MHLEFSDKCDMKNIPITGEKKCRKKLCVMLELKEQVVYFKGAHRGVDFFIDQCFWVHN
jgi:hypothetical protein